MVACLGLLGCLYCCDLGFVCLLVGCFDCCFDCDSLLIVLFIPWLPFVSILVFGFVACLLMLLVLFNLCAAYAVVAWGLLLEVCLVVLGGFVGGVW